MATILDTEISSCVYTSQYKNYALYPQGNSNCNLYSVQNNILILIVVYQKLLQLLMKLAYNRKFSWITHSWLSNIYSHFVENISWLLLALQVKVGKVFICGQNIRGMSSNHEYFVPPAVQQVQNEQLDAVTALVMCNYSTACPDCEDVNQ